MNKKALKAAVFAAGMGVSATASANFFQDVGNWINDNIVQPVQQNIIDPITGAINDAQGYINLIQEAAGQVGYTGTVGNQAFVMPQRLAGPTGELDVVTFNIKGFPEVLNGISDAQTSDLTRASINGKGYDIIGIQENWVRNYALMSALTGEHPYRSDHFQGSAISFGDGLSTISRYPMRGRQYHQDYVKCSGTYQDLINGTTSSPDCETEKGFTFAEVQIAKDFVVHVYNTHMDATGGSKEGPGGQIEQLQNYIAARSAGMPVILMGDFNSWIDNGQYAPGPNQSALGAMASNLGLTWACAVVAPENTNRTSPTKGRCGEAGVDHIAYRGNAQFSFSVISEYIVSQNISDHNPVHAKLRWTNNAYSENAEEQNAVQVAFRTAHGAYLMAENNGGANVRQSYRGDADVWETFTMIKQPGSTSNPRCIQSGDVVNIRTGNGHYFIAYADANLSAQAGYAHTWEKFTVVNHSDAAGCLQHGDRISLRTYHNDYVAAESNGDVNANRHHMQSWETFTVEFTGSTYKQIGGGLKQVSTGSDGETWGVNGANNIYRWEDGYGWRLMPGALSQVSVGNKNNVWALGTLGQPYKWNSATNSWDYLGGTLKWMSGGHDGELWGVNHNDDIFRFSGGTWHHVGGKLKQISVGSINNIWGVNSSNQAFRWQWGHGWVHVPGGVSHVSAAADGSVWILCACGTIQYRVGNEWRLSKYANQNGAILSFEHGGGKEFWMTNTNHQIFNYGK